MNGRLLGPAIDVRRFYNHGPPYDQDIGPIRWQPSEISSRGDTAMCHDVAVASDVDSRMRIRCHASRAASIRPRFASDGTLNPIGRKRLSGRSCRVMLQHSAAAEKTLEIQRAVHEMLDCTDFLSLCRCTADRHRIGCPPSRLTPPQWRNRIAPRALAA